MAGNIHRQKKNRDFVTIDTHCLRNKDLRWDAKGLHSYLMQLPDDWKINVADLEKRSLDRHDGTMSPMRALIAAGYVYRERISGEKGRFVGYDYHLFERPEQTIEWLTVNGKSIDGKTVNGKSTTSKVLKHLSDVSKNEGEGERTPPAPNPSNLKEEKKENGLVAPGREKSTADIIFEMAAEYGIEAEIPPSKKVAPKKDSPEYFEAEPYLGEFQRWRKCFHCAGTGFQLTGEVCAMCEGDGIGRDKKEPAQQFDVTAIASPTRLPGVTLVEAAPKPIQPWERPLPGSPKELKNVLLRYSEENPENWRDNVLESGRATGMTKEKIDEYLTDFCQWQFQQDSTKGRLSQYTAGFSLWLKRQPRFEVMNAPKEGSPTRNAQQSQKANLNHWGANPGGYEEKQAF